MNIIEARFRVGEIIHHRRFDYRGVIVDVDATFQGTEEWYREMAISRPPKDRPWYHVLVHDAGIETYVAERNLEPDSAKTPINHPEISTFFSEFRNGAYIASRTTN